MFEIQFLKSKDDGRSPRNDEISSFGFYFTLTDYVVTSRK